MKFCKYSSSPAGFRDKKRRDHGGGGSIGSFNLGGEKKKVLIDDNSPVVQEFRKYAAVMNAKQDKFERLVKVSRDITIESKRVIFLLHTLLRYVLIQCLVLSFFFFCKKTTVCYSMH